jgi:hypothetical protein
MWKALGKVAQRAARATCAFLCWLVVAAEVPMMPGDIEVLVDRYAW